MAGEACRLPGEEIRHPTGFSLVQSPILLSPEPESFLHNLAPIEATSPRHMKAQPRQSLGLPLEAVSPQGPRVGYSFDSTEVQSPVLLSSEPESFPHNLAPNEATSPRHMKAQPRQNLVSPLEVASPQGPRVGYSFDSTELLWTLCSIVFMTVFVPMVVFLMPHTRAGRPPQTFSAIAGVATVPNVTTSPLTMSQGVNVDWNYAGDPCNQATSTSVLFD
ncbi:hypothetical protein HPB50_015863 [Hyalomma asiaticum]|uniref:Uncharacterized protein n=1 Tax=Hyalomma asiaticum TaxID=266040 RepID=A0ACB7T2F3_HYAAI|nr:hypothetical protein HPB50_015863 [Hyalomma asiaticum]